MSAPLFSVIVPTYNRAALLRAAVTSVVEQRFPNFETIVVDDGSSDGSDEVLRSFGDRIRSVRQANRGPGAARNLGAAHAHGRYLAFLDSDDLWFPWALDVYAAVVMQGDPSFVAGKPFQFRHVDDLSQVREESVVVKRFDDYFASGDQWRWWGASSFVIRADVFNAAGGFASEWINGEDADLALRLGDARGFAQVAAPHTFAYREHDANASSDPSRTLAGLQHAVKAEQQHKYPGGATRALERRAILTRHARPIILDCLRSGARREAWQLYRQTFSWNAQSGHWRFLAGFPLLSVASRFGVSHTD